jgi:hypothetical protein
MKAPVHKSACSFHRSITPAARAVDLGRLVGLAAIMLSAVASNGRSATLTPAPLQSRQKSLNRFGASAV